VTQWFGAAALADVAAGEGLTTSVHGDINGAETLMADCRKVIDLREIHEWNAGHIPGAQHQPLGTIRSGLATLDRDTPVAVHCHGGTRSAIGASVLEAMGFTDVVDLTAGISGWRGAPSRDA